MITYFFLSCIWCFFLCLLGQSVFSFFDKLSCVNLLISSHFSYSNFWTFWWSSYDILHVKPGCSSELSGVETEEAQLVEIKVLNLLVGCLIFGLCCSCVILYFSSIFDYLLLFVFIDVITVFLKVDIYLDCIKLFLLLHPRFSFVHNLWFTLHSNPNSLWL